MPKEELKEYITIVYEMESSVYEQKTIIQRIEEKIEELGKIAKPVNINKSLILDQIVGFGILWLFCMGCFWVIAKLIDMIFDTNLYGLHGIIRIGLAAIFLFLGFQNYSEEQEKYENEVNDYEIKMSKKSRLEKVLPQCKERYAKSSFLLAEIYSCNIIYPKYRNLIAVSSFYDYLMSGRCYSLEATGFGGSDGAYNIYEQEARLDRIITQLDTVIACLNQIKSNQYMLYKAITNSNQKVDQLCDSLFSANQALTDINQNMTLLNYNSELTRKELEYQNRMNRIYHVWG